MNNSLYGEILHHLQNGADAADIKQLVDEAQKEITESDNKHLDEACRNFKEATLAFYNAFGISIDEELINKTVDLARKLIESIKDMDDVVDPQIIFNAFLSLMED